MHNGCCATPWLFAAVMSAAQQVVAGSVQPVFPSQRCPSCTLVSGTDALHKIFTACFVYARRLSPLRSSDEPLLAAAKHTKSACVP